MQNLEWKSVQKYGNRVWKRCKRVPHARTIAGAVLAASAGAAAWLALRGVWPDGAS